MGRGKSVSTETSIKSALREIVPTNAKVYYILWKYAPHLLDNPNIKTFEDLCNEYSDFKGSLRSEAFCDKWLYEENVQRAITMLKSKLHHQRMVELYDINFEKAKNGDKDAFKAFVDISKLLFGNSKESELVALITSVEMEEEND